MSSCHIKTPRPFAPGCPSYRDVLPVSSPSPNRSISTNALLACRPVINVVGLTRDLIGEHTPNIARLARDGELRTLTPDCPAVTSTVQSSMLTGAGPTAHGIVANGWYERDLAEVRFWKQSNRIVTGEKVWETARRRDPSVTTANMFWWFNMYSTAEWSVTPRPIYKADGRKIPDCSSAPGELRDVLQAELGTFPLFRFWGPAASIESSRWIANASRIVHERHAPTLTLVYLPHLDYALQQVGPDHPRIADECRAIDAEVGELATYFENAGAHVVLVSEYGIDAVTEQPRHGCGHRPSSTFGLPRSRSCHRAICYGSLPCEGRFVTTP